MAKYKKNTAACTALLALLLIILPGCSKSGGGGTLEYQNGITGASVKWERNGISYEGTIDLCGGIPENRSEIRESKINVTAPEEISGISVNYSAEGAEASVAGVSMKLPDNMGRELYFLVRSLSFYPDELKGAGNGEGDSVAVRFEAPAYGIPAEYEITYNGEGYPAAAKITWESGEISVNYPEIYVEEGSLN